MKSSEKKILLKKLYKGECTKKELDMIFQLVPTLPPEEAEKVMAELWQQTENYPKLQAELSEKMYGRVLDRIRKKKDTSSVEGQKDRTWARKKIIPLALQAAAIILLGVVAFWLWFTPAPRTVIATAFGEQKTIELPDGSRVQLNANSTLEYQEDWEKASQRQVWLTGEAFFEITKKPETGQKFQVITADLTVEVLGTVFNVNNREDHTDVFLEEGSIALQLKHQPEQSKIMQPGEMLSYSSQKRQILANTNDTSANLHTSWKDGVLIFEETPLPTVLEKIEEIYGITFSVSNSISAERTMTGGLPMEEVQVVIPMLEQALGVEIDQKGDTYIIQ